MTKPKHKPFNEKMLLASGPLKKYGSLAQSGINLSDLPVTEEQRREVERWRNIIGKTLISKDRIKTETRANEGWRIDTDEALSGEPDCFRLRRYTRPAPIKIGINVSTDRSAWQIQALRGGALLAFTDLCKRQGRKFSIEVCYGNGLLQGYQPVCHVRVALEPFNSSITHICLSSKTCSIFGTRLVDPLARTLGGDWIGVYRFHEFETAGIHEYDFVLDRIESASQDEEYKQIMGRLVKLGVAK